MEPQDFSKAKTRFRELYNCYRMKNPMAQVQQRHSCKSKWNIFRRLSQKAKEPRHSETIFAKKGYLYRRMRQPWHSCLSARQLLSEHVVQLMVCTRQLLFEKVVQLVVCKQLQQYSLLLKKSCNQLSCRQLLFENVVQLVVCRQLLCGKVVQIYGSL